VGKSQFWRELLVQCHWYSFIILSGIGLLLIIVDIKQTLPTVFMVAVLLAPEQQQEQLHEHLLLFFSLS
jgi:putative Mn2+ efflux pump MntP